jgi:hypothetical protein
MADKLDMKKTLKEVYKPPRSPMLVDVPELAFVMVDGQGYPGTSQEYVDAMQALYGISYTLKFMLKEEGRDYAVMPLEGLWWADDMDAFLAGGDKDDWRWTSLIAQPDFVTEAHVERALAQVRDKQEREAAKAERKGEEFRLNPKLDGLRFERWTEGLSAQVMHVGPYSEEAPTIEALHAFIEEQGYARRDKHHEIYLGDPRRTKPENLKTVIRQPVG